MPESTAQNPLDAYTPAEVARLTQNTGKNKASLSITRTLVLAILAGAFISFGAMLYTLVIIDSSLDYGLTRWAGGVAFSLGLILVVIAGAELFTGNNLIVIAWASGFVSTRRILRNWSLVYIGNFIGAVATAWMVQQSGILEAGNGIVATTAIAIAESKVQLDFQQAFFRGVLCNALVYLSVWLCMAAHSVSSKILAIIFPVSAFVALGFEHSIANMYFIPLGHFLGSDMITITGLLDNLIPVTLGNIFGGSILVALVYWISFLKNEPQ